MNDDLDLTELKRAVNELVWQYGPPNLPLAQAEKLAILIHERLVASWERFGPDAVEEAPCPKS